MKTDKLLDAIGMINDGTIEEAKQHRQVSSRSWMKWGIVAACLCVVAVSSLLLTNMLSTDKSPVGEACAGNLGKLVDGVYYFVDDNGVYRYTLEDGLNRIVKAQLIPSGDVEGSGQSISWDVDESALFYLKDNSLYIKKHGADKARRLYEMDKEKYSRIMLNYLENGNPVITQYNDDNKTKETVMLDAQTGDLKDYTLKGSNVHSDVYYAGDRVFISVEGEDRDDLLENGVSVLPEGSDFINARELGDNLLVKYRTLEEHQEYQVVFTSDGRCVDVGDIDFLTGWNDYLLYVEEADISYNVYCLDIDSGEIWLLESNMDIYEAAMDSTWLYTCVPWNGGRTDCWKLVYDTSGKLTGLKLVDQDITDN